MRSQAVGRERVIESFKMVSFHWPLNIFHPVRNRKRYYWLSTFSRYSFRFQVRLSKYCSECIWYRFIFSQQFADCFLIARSFFFLWGLIESFHIYISKIGLRNFVLFSRQDGLNIAMNACDVTFSLHSECFFSPRPPSHFLPSGLIRKLPMVDWFKWITLLIFKNDVSNLAVNALDHLCNYSVHSFHVGLTRMCVISGSIWVFLRLKFDCIFGNRCFKHCLKSVFF